MPRWQPFRLARLRRHCRALAALASLAVLLLLAMPTAVRLLGGGVAAMPAGMHAMAMVPGASMPAADHQLAAAPTDHHAREGRAPVPDGTLPLPDHGGSCPYCPLLTSIITLAPAITIVPGLPEPHHATSMRRLAYHDVPHHGLGARGPPAPL